MSKTAIAVALTTEILKLINNSIEEENAKNEEIKKAKNNPSKWLSDHFGGMRKNSD